MHLVGSYYTDISRCTVNKTLKICQLQFRDLLLLEHCFISLMSWSSRGGIIQWNLPWHLFISFCVTKPSLVSWRWEWSQSLKRSTNFTPGLGCLTEKTLLNFFLVNSNIGGPGSSATDYRLEGPGSNPGGGRDFPSVQTGTGTHPASCTMGTESFPGVEAGALGWPPTPI